MLKKARAQAEAGGEDSAEFPQNLKEMSRQIWLAGLGAFSRAQAEGMKMFEALVEQGQNLEARTRRAASETAAAAAGAAAQKAKEVQAMAGGTWDKLEQVFEERVARALAKLGVYTQEDVARLAERVDALSEAVNTLIRQRAGGATKPATPARAARKAKGTTAKTKTSRARTSAKDAPPEEPTPADQSAPARTKRARKARKGA